MGFFETGLLAVTCWLFQSSSCAAAVVETPAAVAGVTQIVPQSLGESLDVVLSSEAALAWDEASGMVLYEHEADVRRPVASVVKLLTALTVLERLSPEQIVVIPLEVRRAQRFGAHVRLPVGETVTVAQLLEAALVPSANDAAVALAVAAYGSEEAYVTAANERAVALGLLDTRVANATGLSGGEQYSTARDVRRLMQAAQRHPVLASLLARERGSIRTQEGTVRSYLSTNKLLETYVPVRGAKTGYTAAAGQNLVLATTTTDGNQIGAVVLGSADRFQDMKVLVEWIERNFTWPS